MTEKTLVVTRKNKNYTSVLMNEISEEAFAESKKVSDSIEGSTVIKPTKKAFEAFLKLHSLTLDKVKSGEKYKILGTTYEVVRSLDYNRSGSNNWYAIVRFYDRTWQKDQEIGIVSTDNFAHGVLEDSFQNATGRLMYF